MNSPDLVRLRLAIQVGLLTNVPSSARIIWVNLIGDQIRLTVVFERQPTDDERELLIDAACEAEGDFERILETLVEFLVDTRPMATLMKDIPDERGYMVYARYEDDYG